jgi:hypothetical protein
VTGSTLLLLVGSFLSPGRVLAEEGIIVIVPSFCHSEVELGLRGSEFHGGAFMIHKNWYCDLETAMTSGAFWGMELKSLKSVYTKTNGDHWNTSTSWMIDPRHCK